MGQLWGAECLTLSTGKQSHLHRTAWRDKNRILPDKGKGKLKILLILCMCRELQRDLISWVREMLGSGLTCSGSCSRQRPGEWCTAACHSSTRSGERTHTAKQGRKAASPWGLCSAGLYNTNLCLWVSQDTAMATQLLWIYQHSPPKLVTIINSKSSWPFHLCFMDMGNQGIISILLITKEGALWGRKTQQ